MNDLILNNLELRVQGKTLLSGYGIKNTVICVKMEDLVNTLTKIENKYLAERVLQDLGVNYDAGE